jgi:hypothetical protein
VPPKKPLAKLKWKLNAKPKKPSAKVPRRPPAKRLLLRLNSLHRRLNERAKATSFPQETKIGIHKPRLSEV